MHARRPDPTTDPRPVGALLRTRRPNERSFSCPTCAVVTRHPWCNAHDPAQEARKQAPAQRVALYRQKAGLA